MKKNITGTIYISTQNISRKGALFIEYALLLAFVAIVGVTFTADSSIGGNITNIFSKTASVLDGSNKSGGLEEKKTKRPSAKSTILEVVILYAHLSFQVMEIPRGKTVKAIMLYNI